MKRKLYNYALIGTLKLPSGRDPLFHFLGCSGTGSTQMITFKRDGSHLVGEGVLGERTGKLLYLRKNRAQLFSFRNHFLHFSNLKKERMSNKVRGHKMAKVIFPKQPKYFQGGT
jgi:hypothetical protein